MAYQTRQRDPLLDSNMQAALEKRGREGLGIVLILAGIALFLMLLSYVADDPSWWAATDAMPENLLGRFGASMSAILMLIVGWGAYFLAFGMLVWGGRLAAHIGNERSLSRIIFLPIAVALAAIYAATHQPPVNWDQSYGLGGLFGDTILGALLNVLPMAPAAGLKVLAAISFVALLWLGLFVLGFSKVEIRVCLGLSPPLPASGPSLVRLAGGPGRRQWNCARAVGCRPRPAQRRQPRSRKNRSMMTWSMMSPCRNRARAWGSWIGCRCCAVTRCPNLNWWNRRPPRRATWRPRPRTGSARKSPM